MSFYEFIWRTSPLLFTNTSSRGERWSCLAIEDHHIVIFEEGGGTAVFKGRGTKGGVERKEYLTCLLQLPAADGVPPNLHLPAREQPASDKGSRLENDVWREGVWRKEVELKRGRTSEETLREGKRSGTQGGLLRSQK